MDNKLPPLLSPRSWICSIFDHRFTVSQRITDHIKEYRCTRCGEERTDTAQGLIAKLTPKFRETNAYIAKIHKRRCSKKVFSQKELSRAS